LAECYYINGKLIDAVRTGRTALERATRNRSYYQDQLEKFSAALPEGVDPDMP
jgi:hypothetical protein